jgi:hypothetical protein
MDILLVNIGGYSIINHWWLFYWWLLMIIDDYYNINYCWLIISWPFFKRLNRLVFRNL